MPDETELRRDINRAKQAEALINDPLLNEAFDKLRELYVEELLGSAAADATRREKLYLAARIVPAVRKNLETILMNGSIAAKQLANLEEDQKRNRR